MINDSLKTTLCIRFPPKAICAAAIYVAAEQASINLLEIMHKSDFNSPIEAEIFPNGPKDMVNQIASILRSQSGGKND